MNAPTNRFAELPLEQLIEHALYQLLKLRYSRNALKRYRTVWQHFAAFCCEAGQVGGYSEEMATRFIERYQAARSERLTAQTGWRRHVNFGVLVLRAFAREGRVDRPVVYTEQFHIPQPMKKPLSDFEQFCRERLHLRPTSLKERMRTIAVFLNYLEASGITALDQLQPDQVTSFVISRGPRSPRSASRGTSDLRSFLRYLLQRQIVHRDLALVLPTIRVPRDGTIPSVWDPELVGKLLKVIDRTSPRGKRDYAILLLASRLGLRSGDIRTLKLDDLQWDTATIEIRQSKTGGPLCLPMSEEIGEALIDYLKAGRPQTPHREVFLRAKLPFTPIGADSRLHHVVSEWRQRAGIEFRTPQRCGLHSLRHTLATRLLQGQTPLHVISNILGHATTASTMIYAKADVESLRGAALDPEEVCHGE